MKMSPRFILWTVGLLPILLASACAPAVPTQPPAVETVPALTDTPVPTAAATIPSLALPTPTMEVIATSRGPNLEATDPITVSLASGGVQLVEFFRFT